MASSKPQTNPNESLPYRILHATRWSKGGRGEKPMRLVVIGYIGRKNGPYAIRWQDKSNATFGGYSYETRENALDGFINYYKRHNQSFGPGNISHLPGIVK